jgi:hypothetical protein
LAACANVIADTRFAPTSTHLFPRLGYASGSWCTASVGRKIMTFAVHKRWFTRAAGVSPPWCGKQSPCGENRTLPGDWRGGNQERRASARRGVQNRPRTVRSVQYSATSELTTKIVGRQPAVVQESHRQHRTPLAKRGCSHATGGLRPPLLAACADVIADIRFAPTSTLLFPRLAHASRSWLHLRLLLQICVSHRRACQCFPRLAYVSRSWCTASVGRKITTFPVHKRTFPRAAGVSPPCERNAFAMARVFPGASTFAHHGGLTPAALGCTCGCYCRYAFLTGEHASVSHGWLTPAAPGGWRCGDSQNRRL